ncbi:MAG: PEP-CTERM sorting domain-containing protein [Phycisphaeraceae bacterium]|nr:PEP-CTERM sorting domain-containing protein [Phycisphaeraceae bacterium]
MSISKVLLPAFATAALVTVCAPAQADFIRPVSGFATSNFNDTTDIAHTIQEIGTNIGGPTVDVALSEESAAATHGQDNGGDDFGQWHSAVGTTTGVSLIYDLGSEVDLETLHLWQANQTGGNFNRGINQFDVLISSTASASDNPSDASFVEVITDANLAISAGGDISAQNFDLTGLTGQFIQIRIDSNHGSTAVTGLSEVRVTGVPVPEPGSLALLGLSGLMIARRRRG